MATVKCFEELEVWQNARALNILVYQYSKKDLFELDAGLVKQIRSAAGSVMDNIAEGFERGGRKEFIQFLIISKGSCGEVRSQLYRAKDQDYITLQEFDLALSKCLSISKMTQRFIEYLNHTDIKGPTYKVKEDQVDYPGEV